MRRPGEEPARGGKPSAHPLGEDLSKVYSGRERWPRPEGAKTNPPADSSLIRRRGPACIVEGEASKGNRLLVCIINFNRKQVCNGSKLASKPSAEGI